jgi:hypothetical protein
MEMSPCAGVWYTCQTLVYEKEWASFCPVNQGTVVMRAALMSSFCMDTVLSA